MMRTLNVATFCTGIGAVECALKDEPDWRVLAMAEIEPFPCKVLDWHYGCGAPVYMPSPLCAPDAGEAARREAMLVALGRMGIRERKPGAPVNYGDLCQIRGSDLPPGLDIFVAGTPCQSFSVAGLRLGLNDDRGNLTFEFLRIANEYERFHNTKINILWENVPGVLSDSGNAFGEFISAGCGGGFAAEPGPRPALGKSSQFWRWAGSRGEHVPKWPAAGWLAGPQRTAAWRVLDAQYFGLAQRRKRVFLMESPCAGPDPRKVLFEWGGRRRDTPPRRETGQDLAGTPDAGFGRSRGAGTPPGGIVNTLTGSYGAGGADDNRAQAGFYVPEIVRQAISCKWSKGSSGPAGDEHHNLVVPPRPEYADAVALPLRAEGFDASEDGTGRQNLVVTPLLTTNIYGDNKGREGMLVTPINTQVGLRHKAVAITPFDTTQITSPDNHSNPRPGDPCGPVLSNAHPPAIAFHGSRDPDVSGEINANAVRRLMPLECERLQGFPDGYTLVPYRAPWASLAPAIINRSYRRYVRRMGKRGVRPLELEELMSCADGPRYKALGNSMAVPVMRWILRRMGAALRVDGCNV